MKKLIFIVNILKMIEEDGDDFDAGFYEIDGKQGYFINSLGAGFDAVISNRAKKIK